MSNKENFNSKKIKMPEIIELSDDEMNYISLLKFLIQKNFLIMREIYSYMEQLR